MSDYLKPHGQHARLPCPSLSAWVRSNPCPSSWWCHPTIPSSVTPSPFALNLSQHQGLFQWIRSSHQVARGLELQLQYQSFQWIFRVDFIYNWFDLLAVQGTLKSLLQDHISKASILQHSAFFMVQLSHPHMTTGETIALTIQSFVSKVMFLLFNTLSRFVIAFPPRSKRLLISDCSHHPQWLWSPRKENLSLLPLFPVLFAHEVMGPDVRILVFWMLSFKPAFSLSFHPHQEAL